MQGEEGMTLETFLMRRAGMDAGAVEAFKRRLAGSKLLLGAEALLRFKPEVLVRSATWQRLRAQAMLRTEPARLVFDELVREGYGRIAFDGRQRRAVVMMAHMVSMLRDLIELQSQHGPLRPENLPPSCA